MGNNNKPEGQTWAEKNRLTSFPCLPKEDQALINAYAQYINKYPRLKAVTPRIKYVIALGVDVTRRNIQEFKDKKTSPEGIKAMIAGSSGYRHTQKFLRDRNLEDCLEDLEHLLEDVVKSDGISWSDTKDNLEMNKEAQESVLDTANMVYFDEAKVKSALLQRTYKVFAQLVDVIEDANELIAMQGILLNPGKVNYSFVKDNQRVCYVSDRIAFLEYRAYVSAMNIEELKDLRLSEEDSQRMQLIVGQLHYLQKKEANERGETVVAEQDIKSGWGKLLLADEENES